MPHRSPHAAPDALAPIHAAPLFRPGSTVPGTASPGVAIALGSLHGNAPEMHAAARHGDLRPGWLRRSLRASLFEGMLAEVVAACAGGGLVTGWALELGCSPFLLALFAALPFLSQLVHLPSAWFSAHRNRRRLALVASTASRQLLLGLALLPVLDLTPRAEQLLFAAIVGLSSVCGVVGNNAWMSWMGDLVPDRLRARYFARRASLSTIAGACGALGAGLVLDRARHFGHGVTALALLSIVAWAAGTVCSLLIGRQVDPVPAHRRPRPGPQSLGEPWRCPRARPVLAYQLLWNAAIGVAASFFGLFLLRDLKLGFSFLALHGAVIAGVRAVATPLWGRALDRVGTRPVLVTTSFGIALLPLLWLTAEPRSYVVPLAIDAVLGGVMWAGHGLASFQLPLVLARNESRPFYVAAFASTGGLAFAVAALAGGAIVPFLPSSLSVGGTRLRGLELVFVLSACLRFAAWGLSMRVQARDGAPVPQLWRSLSWWPAWLRYERCLELVGWRRSVRT